LNRKIHTKLNQPQIQCYFYSISYCIRFLQRWYEQVLGGEREDCMTCLNLHTHTAFQVFKYC